MAIQGIRDFPEPPRPQPTGRKLVVFNRDADMPKMQSTLANTTGGRIRDRREFAGSATAFNETLAAGETVVFHRQKVAVVAKPDVQASALEVSGVEIVRPEFYMFAIDELRKRYADWVRQGLQMLVEGYGTAIPSGLSARAAESAAASFADNNETTWGLQAIGVPGSRFTGRGINVAVLDTGLDFEHPDFVGRQITRRSFVEGQSEQDGQGHGTHTAGTVAGPMRSSIGRRYGVAPDVNLHIGKVLNNSGTGKEGEILDGMNWAIDQKCVAISMSLGRPTTVDERTDPVYERTGAAALLENCLIIAAAGNESSRDFGFIAPVGAPANSPSIMAVAAVDPLMNVAPFSCGGLSPTGKVDISGPGVAVFSSFPLPRQSRLLPGTSMACPHVAGAAALWAESDPWLRGQKLWDALVGAARGLGIARDFGSGLVQGPGGGAIA